MTRARAAIALVSSLVTTACSDRRDIIAPDLPPGIAFVAVISSREVSGLVRRQDDRFGVYLSLSAGEDLLLLGYEEAEIAALGPPAEAELRASRLRPALDVEPALPVPAWAAEVSAGSSDLEPLPARGTPRLTADWLSPCEPSLDGARVALTCLAYSCAGVIEQNGCAIEVVSQTCSSPKPPTLRARIDASGRAQFETSDQLGDCESAGEGATGDLTFACPASKGSCHGTTLGPSSAGPHLELAASWTLGDGIVGANFYDNGDLTALHTGYLHGLAVLGDTVVVSLPVLDGAPVSKPLGHRDTPTELAFLDATTLTPIGARARPRSPDGRVLAGLGPIRANEDGDGFFGGFAVIGSGEATTRYLGRFTADGTLTSSRALPAEITDNPELTGEDRRSWTGAPWHLVLEGTRLGLAGNIERSTQDGLAYLTIFDWSELRPSYTYADMRAQVGGLSALSEGGGFVLLDGHWVFHEISGAQAPPRSSGAALQHCRNPDLPEAFAILPDPADPSRVLISGRVQSDATSEFLGLFSASRSDQDSPCGRTVIGELLPERSQPGAMLLWPRRGRSASTDLPLVLVGFDTEGLKQGPEPGVLDSGLAFYDPAHRRFLSGAIRIGQGVISELVMDARGRVFALLPHQGRVARIEVVED